MKPNQLDRNPISIKVVQKAAAPLTIRLTPAADKTAPGLPGKQVGEILVFPTAGGQEALVSLGDASKITADVYRQAGGALAVWFRKLKVERAAFAAADLAEAHFSAFCEGLFLGAFTFDRYKSDAEPVVKTEIECTGGSEAVIDHAQALCAAVNLARDWAHEPANVINPVTLSGRVQELAKEFGLTYREVDEKALESMGAGGLFSVGKGSQAKPRLIILEYPGSGAPAGTKPVVLVGKAITFDTGGYSLKGTENIQGMKGDKCGGVTVAATLMAAAALKLKQPLVGLIPAAENMISGDAYRPDDILRMLSGKTVEIISTDAEGRLILADALTYAQKEFTPHAVIDLATLTGGVVVALGRVRAGLMCNHDELAERLAAAGEATHERMWRLPLDDDYARAIKSDDADIKNSGGREAQPVIGGIFLKQFVANDVPWAHVDIAGVADSPKDDTYRPKGATGFGVRMLVNYLESL